MKCRISRSLLARLLADARAAGPNEICGLLLGSRDEIVEAVATANLASDPTAGFEIDPGEHLALARSARALGREIVGCYHSHPRGHAIPSAIDRARAAQDGFLWLIVAGEDVRLWLAGASHGFVRFSPVVLEAETIALQPSPPEANRRPAWA